MRVLLAGRHELAAAVLRRMPSGFDVFYAEPKRSGHDRGESSLDIANGLGFGVVPDDGDPALGKAIDAARPDVLLSCGYPRIIKDEVLVRVPVTANVHFGALPRYRGSFSIPWAILNGDPQIGVTLHEIRPGIDDGPIIEQRMIDDDGRRSCRELYEEAVVTGTAMALGWLLALARGESPKSVEQDEQRATYYPPSYPGGFHIDFRQTLLQVTRYIRASHFPPFPSAHGLIENTRVAFDWPVTTVVGTRAMSGEIVELLGGTFGVTVLNGVIVPGTVTVDGRTFGFPEAVREFGWLGARLK
jgi:methionyl-tRNA formyltransferase